MAGEPEITSEGLCDSPHCPAASSPDWHACFVCGNPQGDHHHIEKRSQRPDLVDDPTNIVFLCRKHHDKIDNDLWTNKLIEFPDGSIHYVVFDLKGKSMADRVVHQGTQVVAGDIERVIGEGGKRVRASQLGVAIGTQQVEGKVVTPSAPLSDHPPETLPAVQEANIVSVTLPVFPRGVTPNLMGLNFDDLVTYEEWAAIGPKLALLGDWLPWAVGDWLKHGQWAYGEKYAQAASETGLKEERLVQYQWVAERVENNTRVRFSALHWTHFRAVAALPAPQQAEWLQRAADEGLTTRQLHHCVAVHRDPASECEHEWVNVMYVKCSKCGRLRDGA